MSCPVCGSRTVSFAVPEALQTHAPESGTHATLCATCLRTFPADDADESSLDAVAPTFPTGEAGAALALALGHLNSLALKRDAIDDCCSYAERAGADVLLTLDRLADEPDIDPHFDIDRRRPQLAEMLE